MGVLVSLIAPALRTVIFFIESSSFPPADFA